MRITLIIAFLFFYFSSFAQEDKLNFSYLGYGELDQIQYLKNEEGKINSRFQSLLNIELNASLNAKSAFKTSFELRNDLADPSRNRIFLDEFYFDIFTKQVDIRIGRQIINWGQADSFNPLNNINATDFTDILDTEEEILPSYAARFKYYIKDFTFDAVLVPVFTPSLLSPISSSRWSPDLPTVMPNPMNPETMLTAKYNYGQRVKPLSVADDFQAGLKTSYSLPGWDLALSYYYGWNDIPKFSPSYTFIDQENVEVTLFPDYYKWHVIGADFSTSLGEFGFRGESALFISEASEFYDKDPAFVQMVLGVDKTFVNVIQDNNLSIIAEWIQEFVIDGERFPSNDFNHIFQQALFLRVKQNIGSYADFTIQSVYDFRAKSFYVEPAFTYEISQGLQLKLSANIINTNNVNAFFYPYTRNDRLQFKMRYSF